MMNLKIRLSELKTFEDFEKFMAKKYEKTIHFTINMHTGKTPQKTHIALDRLEVKKVKRRKGNGTKFMTDLCLYADYSRNRIELLPVPLDKEITKERLEKFYRRFGFKYRKNQTCTMLRCPRPF